MRAAKSFLLLVVSVSLLFACSGTKDDGAPDAATTDSPDAAAGNPDAMLAAAGMGSACTPDQANPQADCPADFICLATSATTGWCTKTCTSQSDPVCMTGYTGPGWAGCFIGVDTNGDQMPDFTACGVICQDMGAGVCTGTITCDGSCPGALTCSGAVSDGSSQVATSCQ